MNTKSMMMVATLSFVAQAFAAVTVTNVTCQQRYPWNGLVDIDYEIRSDDAEAQYLVYPKGTDRRLGTKMIMRTFSGDGAGAPVGVGKHRLVWDAKKDMPSFYSSDVAVSIQIVSAAAEYLVIDLSGGTNSVTYPVRYSATGPDIANDRCRTTELWLRLVLPGTFMMGSPSDEKYRSDNEVQHQVTLTRPYFIGVFELTQKQWQLIMGTSDVVRYAGPCRPVDKIAYSQVRGVSANGYGNASDDISASSFLGVLRRKTALPFDLPTEAQWEHACRAGTTTAWNDGTTTIGWSSSSDDGNLNRLGRYKNNRSDGQESYNEHTKVGLYKPNSLGLYDMHGNVCEWCRDAYRAKWTTDALVDPEGGDGASDRVLRGGCHLFYPADCRSASRVKYMSNGLDAYIYPSVSSWTAAGSIGFRVGCFPVE